MDIQELYDKIIILYLSQSKIIINVITTMYSAFSL